MISDELRKIINARNISLRELSEKASIPYETLRNIYYGKVDNPRLNTIIHIADVLNISIDDLVCRNHLKDDEKRLLEYYRLCGTHGKDILETLAKFESESSCAERSYPKKRSIPCLIPVGDIYDGIHFSTTNIVRTDTVFPNVYLAIEITTDNFSPMYCKNDRILLENRFPIEHEAAVFLKNNHAYFRIYETTGNNYILKCINGRGTDIITRRMDQYWCIGTCVGIKRS